jgi:hypothetical protein
MRTNGSENTPLEIDMRDLLRAKKPRSLAENNGAENDFSGQVFQISGRSVQEIDDLIEGLRGVRQKLDTDGDRLQREMAKYAEFSETVIQLTKIVSEGMAQVKSRSQMTE